MAVFEGNIRKMRTELNNEVQYFLPVGETEIHLNPLLGKELSLQYRNLINCINCEKKTKTSFSQGYCFNCFNTLPETSISVVHPEKDRSHLGISRDIEWAKQNHLQPHCVYLAYSGNIKVGVTRKKNIPTRWIDQGAVLAVELAKTPNRHIAGVIETNLKKHFSDKTNWKKMLQHTTIRNVNLIHEKDKAIAFLHPELKQYVVDEKSTFEIKFPVLQVPSLIQAQQFEKKNSFIGRLTGIKGQYLIFENGTVINIRRHAGYLMKIIQL